jgi:hypothetical protein
MNGLDGVIKQLEAQKTAIERALEALREVARIEGSPSAAAPVKDTGESRRAAGQKKRWAAKKAQGAEAPAKKAPRRSGMTAEGRKRISEAAKKRWALKRVTGEKKKPVGRPKKVA